MRPPAFTWILLALLARASSAQSFVSHLPYGQGFVERASELGLEHRFLSGLDRIGTLPHMHDWVQVGMTCGDLDGDGDLDFVMMGRIEPNHLWLQAPDGTFVDATDGSGVASAELETCCALVDWDRDGDLDLAIGVYDHGEGALPGQGRLLRNAGDATFTDVTVLAGAFGNGHTLDIQVVDMNLDGWSDLYLSEFSATPNQVWENVAGRAFREVGAAVGADDPGSAHVSGVLDTDGDGWPEIHIGNDWPISFSAGMKHQLGDILLTGAPDGVFADVTAGSGLDENITTMGIAWGDVDYDGDPDGYKTQVGTQYLIVNHGWPASGIPWTRAEWEYGVDQPYLKNPFDPYGLDFGNTVGWGCHFTSIDLDTWVDLVMVCGHVEPQASDKHQRNFLWLGTGPDTPFHDVTASVGLLDHVDDRTLLCADPDRDGDVDLLFGPPGGNLRYFENRLPRQGNGFLVVTPHGSTSAPEAIGARVRWFDLLGLPHTRWPGAEAMTAGQNERAAFFGLGPQAGVDLEVSFPSGVTLTLPGVAADSRIDVVEPSLVELEPAGGVVAPGAVLVVTGYAHDAAGKPLLGAAPVELDVPGLNPLGPVQHAGANVYRRAFRAVAPGDHRAHATFDGFEVRVRPRVTVRGPIDAAATTVRCVPAAVRAGSADTARIEVAPRDADGLPAGPGHAVEVRIGGAAPVALEDQGDGRYAAVVPAPAVAGVHALEVGVDGVELGPLATLESAGPAAPAATGFYAESPSHHVAMNPTLWFGQLTPRDAAGLRLGPGAHVEVLVTPDAKSVPVFLRTDLGPIGQADGEFVFVLERTLPSHPNDAHGTLDVLVDGVFLGSVSFQF